MFEGGLAWPQSKACIHCLLSKSQDGFARSLMDASTNLTAQWTSAIFTEHLLSAQHVLHTKRDGQTATGPAPRESTNLLGVSLNNC